MIIPIAITTVNWDSFLTSVKKLIGESISTSIDEYKLKRDARAFIVTLSELFKGKLTPVEAIAQAGSLLRHGSATFLMHFPKDIVFQLQQETDLAISSIETSVGLLAIVSGNFLQWQVAISNLRHSIDNFMRGIAHDLTQYFELAGLKRITNV